MMKAHSERAHAKFSASGAHRWMNCPGSIALSERAPPQPESDYANEGTLAHECLQLILECRPNPKRALELAKKKYTTEMVDHALETKAWIDARINSSFTSELLIETRVDASSFTCADQFGTLDAAIVEVGERLTVIDYKFGAGVVYEPKDNPQLIYYAAALCHQYGNQFSEIELVIIQPRAYHEHGPVRSHVMKISDMPLWEAAFYQASQLALAPKARLNSGEWCKFCPAAVICPEIKNKNFRQAQLTFDEGEGTLEIPPDPKSIAIPKLGQVLTACDQLETWIQKVREHAEFVLARGESVEGFKLVAKRSTRKWGDSAKVFKEALKKFGKKAFTSPEVLSPAQLEKAFKNVAGTDKWIEKRVTNESSGTTLVPESDKRPAVISTSLLMKD